ncbi:MAG: 4-hydroxythreonine-4-phosphate dehydrogenase PdxA [Deltaproteobacteria bacterium]|nr:4-hydroxythreonine-4-phosphate dehydrogenase PdxA [Deltaproteobacteria bacterium]
MELPKIGITMGDPTGVGPEVIVKSYLEPKITNECIPVVLGDANVMKKTISDLKAKIELNVISVDDIKTLKPSAKTMYLIKLSNLDPSRLKVGRPDKIAAKMMVTYIKEAVRLAMLGSISAMVTAPINKAAINNAGFRYAGHTELLAEITRTEDYCMMLVGKKLKVSLVTTHSPIREVPGMLTPGLVFKTIKLSYDALVDYFNIKNPKIAIVALNPHAGEDGLFGVEEKELIIPGIKKAENMGIQVFGPLPADTAFYFAYKTKYDIVVGIYHDQALIPLKVVNFDDAVNVTLGLPIIRTSVDHGTAYDISGKGIANPESMKAAILLAGKMAGIKMKKQHDGSM